MRNLKTFFGADRAMETITEGDAEDFKLYLIDQKLAPTTVHKRLQSARMFFRDAKKRRMILDNPFAEVSAKAVVKRDRHYFVPREDVDQIMAVCDPTWRTIVGLARYGGLRCPSEVLSLRWELLDWGHDRMVVDSPKTEHHPEGAQRTVPIFPELRPILEEALELAEPGAEYVVGGNYRVAAIGERGWMNCNLRTQLERLIRRAGLKPWPRLLHNLRASRETELAAEFPLHVVTRWLGNTPKIAMKHYLQVTEDDFAKAVGRDGKGPSGPEPRTSDPEPAARSEDPTPKGDSPLKAEPPTKPSQTRQHPGERQPSDRGGSAPGQGGSLGSDRGRDEDRRPGGAAECGAVAVQNAVQSAHAGDCRESTAQSETPVVAGVCANPDERSQPSSRDRNGGDRTRTECVSPEENATF